MPVRGQQPIPALHKKVILRAKEIRFDTLLQLTSKQTGMKFSLNTQKFRPSKMIHVRKGECSIAELLFEIKSSTGINYTFLGDHIIFIDSPPKASVSGSIYQAPVPVPHRSSASLKNLAFASFPPLTNKEKEDTFLMDTQSNVSVDKKYITRINHLNLPPATSSTSGGGHSDRDSRSKVRPDKDNKTYLRDPFVRPGLVIGETFYINPTVEAGLPFIYGIASWSTNFKVSGLRFGAGTSFRLSDEWRLHLTATTGANSKNYFIDSGIQEKPLTVKTRLNIIGLLLEQSINDKLILQFGLSLNFLHTKYYVNGQLATPHANNTEASQYEYIKPIYTIRDSYSSNTAQNSKIWMGLQVSLFYNIHFGRKLNSVASKGQRLALFREDKR